MNDEIAKSVVDAYKVNPVLTGLLLLNIGMFLGFGWFVTREEDRTGAFIQQIRAEKNQLFREMLDLTKTCIVPTQP